MLSLHTLPGSRRCSPESSSYPRRSFLKRPFPAAAFPQVSSAMAILIRIAAPLFTRQRLAEISKLKPETSRLDQVTTDPQEYHRPGKDSVKGGGA
jgi:hypothetical protein